MKERIHKKIIENFNNLQDWYRSQLTGYVPFYGSFDIRDAGFKISNIDGNIFPAGFNNICQMDKDSSPELIQKFMKNNFPEVEKILLLSEDHLKNTFYWENVIAIRSLIEEAGFIVEVGMLSEEIGSGAEVTSFSGKTIFVNRIISKSGKLQTETFVPDLVVSNNDFSNEYESIDFSQTKMTPLRELGWFQRKKHQYFENYNAMAEKFSSIIDEDPWLFQVQTKHFKSFDVASEDSRDELAQCVESLISDIQEKYNDHKITEKPFVFVKNNSGTYGLGVLNAESGDDVRAWNYKSKKKMKATKGGGGVSEVVVQEGVPSVLTTEGATAEPVLYMLGCELAGGFLRTHDKKDSHQSLNSPGAVYKKLCLSDLKVSAEGAMLENVYGWIAKLGFLAISQEATSLK